MTLFLFSWLHWVFIATLGLSVVAASVGYCLVEVLRLLIVVTSPGAAYRLSMGLVFLRHVESFWTRDQTYVSCIGRQILNHSTTRKILILWFYGILMINNAIEHLFMCFWAL